MTRMQRKDLRDENEVFSSSFFINLWNASNQIIFDHWHKSSSIENRVFESRKNENMFLIVRRLHIDAQDKSITDETTYNDARNGSMSDIRATNGGWNERVREFLSDPQINRIARLLPFEHERMTMV
jgi:hypothetical protein